MNKASIVSPLTASNDVQLIKKVAVAEIVETYKKIMPSVDVETIFKGIDSLELYQCKDSGYQFYWPLNVSGSDQYYAQLSKLDWYYMPWKWEHEVALNYIQEGDKVLEVGAAKGDFLKKLKELKGADVRGLELNSEVDVFAKESGVDLLNETIEAHAEKNENTYDVVCSFQVLEHISNVQPFIQSMVKALKKGGTLIIGVPNNDSFVGTNRHYSKVLNMPPHHMGLWREESLQNIAKIFGLEILGTDKESLQDLHFETFLINRIYDLLHFRLLVRIVYKLKLERLLRPYYRKRMDSILGHSINIYFRKP